MALTATHTLQPAEMRPSGAMALDRGIPLIPHARGFSETIHYLATLPRLTWTETTIPAPGGPARACKMFPQQRHISCGPKGISIQASEDPGLGRDFEVSAA